MSRINQNKQKYDRAQKVGEMAEVLGGAEGWRKLFIPAMEKRREDSQKIVNDPETSERDTQFHRGAIAVLDEVLGFVEDKMRNSTALMRKASDSQNELLG